MLLLVFSCFQLSFLIVFPAFLATSLQTSSGRSKNIHHSPVADQPNVEMIKQSIRAQRFRISKELGKLIHIKCDGKGRHLNKYSYGLKPSTKEIA